MTPGAVVRSERRRGSRQVIWVALLVGLLICVLAGAFVIYEATEIRANQRADVGLYARALDNQVAAVMAGGESTLRALAPSVERRSMAADPARLAALFEDNLRGRPYLRSLSLLDAGGHVVASSNRDNADVLVPRGLLGGPLADHLARLGPLAAGRDLRDLGKTPLAEARVLALPMLLQLPSPGGPQLLVALINPEYFATQFERMLEDSSLRALLLSLDGRLIVGTEAVHAAPGTSFKTLPAFSQHLPAREFASDLGPGSDGGRVVSAFRATRLWPLVVLVEQPEAAFYAELARIGQWAAAFVAMGLALLAAGTVILRRTLLHDERTGRELRAADAAARASESRKLAILQSSLDAIVTFDSDHRVIDFNAAAERMFGRGGASVIGRPVHELIPRLGGAHPDGRQRRPGDDGGPLLNRRVEAEAVRADGTAFPVELTIVPVSTDVGEVFTATARDITERQRVERALRDSEARAQATFEQAAVGVLQQGPDRRFLRVNQTLCELLGYTRQEFLALDADTLIHPDDIAPGVHGMQQLFAGKTTSYAQDKRYRHKNGRWVWVRLTASVARDGAGRALYLIGIVEDISARRHAENELAAARQRELDIGARIQQSLLVTAPPPDVDGLQISSWSQASQGIDGDFVEIIRVGPDCVDIITGDVMGKGLPAAMIGAATKLQFSRSIAELLSGRAAGSEPPRPAEVVAAVHRAMTPALQALESFVTLCYLRVDTRHSTVTWVGCGHEEPLRVLPDGTVQVLANQHPPLGVLDIDDYQEERRPLNAGDSLFLCSDGVTDALLPDGQRVGRERLVSAVTYRVLLHDTPAAAVHSLRRDLLSGGVVTQDDVTMVLVQSRPGLHRVEVPVRLDSIRAVRRFVAGQAVAAGLDEAAAGLLVVAGVEAFTNVVRHATGGIEGAPLELVARTTAGRFILELVYPGDPYEHEGPPPETDFSDFPEGGFGITIIHGASDEVEYLHDDGVNTVRIVKEL